MIFPLTPYSETDSEALFNAYQAQLDDLGYPATMKRLQYKAYCVAPIPDSLSAVFDAANYAKQLKMLEIAQQVALTAPEDYNAAYTAIYNTYYA